MSTLEQKDTKNPGDPNATQAKPPVTENKQIAQTNPSTHPEPQKAASTQANQSAATQSQSNDASKAQQKPIESVPQQKSQPAETKKPADAQENKQDKQQEATTDKKEIKPEEKNPQIPKDGTSEAKPTIAQPVAGKPQSQNPGPQQTTQDSEAKKQLNDLQKDKQKQDIPDKKEASDNKEKKPAQQQEVSDKKEGKPEEKNSQAPKDTNNVSKPIGSQPAAGNTQNQGTQQSAQNSEIKKVSDAQENKQEKQNKQEAALDDKDKKPVQQQQEKKDKKEIKPEEKKPQTIKETNDTSKQPADSNLQGQSQGKQASSHNAETKIVLRADETKKVDSNQPTKKTDHQDTLKEEKKGSATAQPQSSVKEKPQAKSTVENQQTVNKPKNQSKDQAKSAESLSEAVASIFSFFSITKTNIEKTSDQAINRLGEIISKSKLVSKIKGDEYQPIITSDVSDLNEKIAKNKSSPNKLVKAKTDTSSAKKSTNTGPKPKFQPSGLRTKGEVEEQIRQHKMEEIKKWKKMLEDKLENLDEQLVEIAKVDEASREASPEVAKVKKVYKETKEEALERQQKALEFAKKMSHAQKELENRKEKRREVQETQVNKQIDVLYQQHLDNIETQKSPVAINKNKAFKIGPINKSHKAFTVLEERKQELRKKREFDKQSSTADETGVQQDVHKQSPKRSYKSPTLDKVLEYDEEQKQIELRKISMRKALHDKQVEYGKDVKKEFLPKLNVSKKLEFHGRLRPGVYRSHNLEAYLKRVGGKDFLYNYIDKMKSKYGGEEGLRGSVDQMAGSGTKSAKDGSERISHHSKRYAQDDSRAEEREEQNYTPHGYDLDEDNYMLTETGNDEAAQPGSESYRDRDGERSRTLQPAKGKMAKKKKQYEDSESAYTSYDARDSTIKQDKRKASVGQAPNSHRKQSEDWKHDLQDDHLVLKEKISSMLNDIKSMEAQVKQKEEKLLKEFESKAANRA